MNKQKYPIKFFFTNIKSITFVYEYIAPIFVVRINPN